MRAALITSPGVIETTVVPDPDPAADEVVLDVAGCGVCGTDLHTLAGHNPLVRYPVIAGHEFAGEVVAVGSAVTRLSVGDRVAVDPSYFCGRCEQCRAGQPNLCPLKGGYGSRKPGGFAEYAAVADASCEPLPESLPLEHAPLAEPLACVLHGLDRLGPVLGQDVLVYGAGPIGLMTTALARRAGARSVGVVDRSEERVRHASTFGADMAAVTAEDLTSAQDGWHAVVDATGAPAAIADGLTRLRRAGRLLVLGVASPSAVVEVSPFDVYLRELTILGSMAIQHTFGRAVGLLADGVVDASALITDRLALDDLPEALERVRAASGLKIHVVP